jgi:hypothetical protein
VRVNTDTGVITLKAPVFLVVTEQQAKSDMEDMKPIEAKDVLDTAIVQKDYPAKP